MGEMRAYTESVTVDRIEAASFIISPRDMDGRVVACLMAVKILEIAVKSIALSEIKYLACA